MHLNNLPETRVLIYSHDNFGLGHLRRCRAIAHALVDRIQNMQVLIISGSSFGSNFEYHNRVQFLNIPSIVKLMNDDHKSIIRLMSGEYTPPPERTDLHNCLAKRKEIIQSAAETFKPHLFIVDYSPLGLRGELEDTLLYLKEQGTRLVLGFRDIMDSAAKLTAEFAHLQDLKRAESIYDALWVFGPRDFYDPLAGIDRPKLSSMMVYTGFIHRDVPAVQLEVTQHVPNDYLLVTAGGGGDGFRMMNAVISAYISDPSLTRHAILVLGPLMDSAPRQKLHEKAAGHPYLHLVDFTLQLEALTSKATALVTMCGYNTFCETLSFDKRALIIPRITAREEQIIRATRAAEVGLADMIHPDDADDVTKLSAALKNVEKRPLPSESQLDLSVSLGGLDAICDIVEDHLKQATASHSEIDFGRFDAKDRIPAQPIVEAIKV